MAKKADGMASRLLDQVFSATSFAQVPDLTESPAKKILPETQEPMEHGIASNLFGSDTDCKVKKRVIIVSQEIAHLFLTIPLQTTDLDAACFDICDAFHCGFIAKLYTRFNREALAIHTRQFPEVDSQPPIIKVFFNNFPRGLVDGDIGRVYFNLCAALCDVAIKAEELRTRQGTDPIVTINPPKKPMDRLLPFTAILETRELTLYGFKISHHLTIGQCIWPQPPIPMYIKSIKTPRGAGIFTPGVVYSTGYPLYLSRPPGPQCLSAPKRLTKVTIKDDISVVNIRLNNRSLSRVLFARVFAILYEHSISIDLMSMSSEYISLAVYSGGGKVDDLTTAKESLAGCGEVSIMADMAILNLVGANMKMNSIAGRFFSMLGEHDVTTKMITQGAGKGNISCVIGAGDATRAINILEMHLLTFLNENG